MNACKYRIIGSSLFGVLYQPSCVDGNEVDEEASKDWKHCPYCSEPIDFEEGSTQT